MTQALRGTGMIVQKGASKQTKQFAVCCGAVYYALQNCSKFFVRGQ